VANIPGFSRRGGRGFAGFCFEKKTDVRRRKNPNGLKFHPKGFSGDL